MNQVLAEAIMLLALMEAWADESVDEQRNDDSHG